MTARPILKLCLFMLSGALSAQELPQIRLTRSTAGTVTLDWPTIPGQSYRLERSHSLDPAFWETIRAPEEASSLSMTFSEANPAAAGFYRLEVSPAKPLVTSVAVMGDSITAQGSRNLYHLSAMGYYGWARLFGGSRWDLVKNPADNTFAFTASGKRSFEISGVNLNRVITADPDICIIVYGTNDAAQLWPVENFRWTLLSDWGALREAGIEPVAVTVPPIGTATGDNSLRHARVSALNQVIRQEAAIHQIALCDWTGLLEALPGSDNGVGLNSHYQNNDDFHPLQYPASLLGRALNATLEQHFRFAADPWENTRWITPNVALEGDNGQPSSGGWEVFIPGNASVGSKALIPSPEGNWWEIAFAQNTAAGTFYVKSSGANLGGSPGGSTVEGIVELEVVSGSIAGVSLQVGAALATDLHGAGGSGAQIVPGDGIVVLRTPPVAVPVGTSSVNPTLAFRSNESSATIRIRRCGIRKSSL